MTVHILSSWNTGTLYAYVTSIFFSNSIVIYLHNMYRYFSLIFDSAFYSELT